MPVIMPELLTSASCALLYLKADELGKPKDVVRFKTRCAAISGVHIHFLIPQWFSPPQANLAC